MPPLPSPRENKIALGFTLGLLSAFCLSSQDLLIKILLQDFNTTQIILFRSVIVSLIATVWVFYSGFEKGLKQLQTQNPYFVFARMFLNVTAWFCYYISLSYLPLTIYTSVGFSVYLFTAILSGIFLKEKLGTKQWIAVMIGIVGVAIIINPFKESFNSDIFPIALLLFGAFTWALSIVVSRFLGATMSSLSILFYTNIGMLVTSLIAISSTENDWSALSSTTLFQLIGVSLFAFLGQFAAISAVRSTQITYVIPAQYTTIIWSSIYAWWFWQESFHLYWILGTIMIILSGLIIVWRKNAGTSSQS